MTAEIALLNRRALAFAADSAATISDGRIDKIYNSAEKIFEISTRSPIGLMLFNSLDFCGVPLDVLARSFRAGEDDVFANCKSACDKFLAFLLGFKRSEADECEYLAHMLAPEMEEIRREAVKNESADLRSAIDKNSKVEELVKVPEKTLIATFKKHTDQHKGRQIPGFLKG